MMLRSIFLALFLLEVLPLQAAEPVAVSVDFGAPLRRWDGFGINYVQVAQTRDYQKDPQEYGGFSTLSERDRREILDLIFGPDGLRTPVIKMFLDPFHQGFVERAGDGRFDHKTTTEWMRYFVREGVRMLRTQGAEPTIITTLYGPPAWATRQKFLRGRDIDMAKKKELAGYMIDWVKFLRESEKLPVNYVSLHNEGEAWDRWPVDGKDAGEAKHDYNAYWHCSIVADFLRFMRPMMDDAGLKDVGLAPGETTSWDKFAMWGYAYAIWNDDEAMKNIGLITSHGFGNAPNNTSRGIDLLRTRKPELQAWTTSMTWGKMDVNFIELVRQQIYQAKVNAVIPWAAVQTLTWYGGDPNPGTAFRVENGKFTVEPGYYFYKQVSRAGQPGMSVATVSSENSDIGAIAFAKSASKSPDAIVVYNRGTADRTVRVKVAGTSARRFSNYRTGPADRYHKSAELTLEAGALDLELGAGNVVTLFAAE